MRWGLPDVKSWQEFLPTLPPLRIGLDPHLFSIADYQSLLPTLPTGSLLVPVENLVDNVWKDKPARPKGDVVLHPLDKAGRSVRDKLDEVRKVCSAQGKWGIVVSMLDEVSLLLFRYEQRAPLTAAAGGLAAQPARERHRLQPRLPELPRRAHQRG